MVIKIGAFSLVSELEALVIKHQEFLSDLENLMK